MSTSSRSWFDVLTFPTLLTGTLVFQAWVGPALGFRDGRLVVFSLLFGVLLAAMLPATLNRVRRKLRSAPPRSKSPDSLSKTLLVPLDASHTTVLPRHDPVD